MDENTKISQIAMRFGLALINKGFEITRNASKVNRVSYPNALIKNFLKEQTGVPSGSISLSDEKYYLTYLEKVKEIIEMDWTNTFKYISDTFDCDNFAMLFASEGANLYGVNTFMTAFGNIYDAKTGVFLFRHAFNLILTQDNSIMGLYLYEPQTDSIALWKKGQDNIIESLNWRYTVDWIIGF